MLIEKIDFTSGQLNATSSTFGSITANNLAVNAFNSKHYRPTQIKVNNKSGATINFALFNDFEYDAYILSPSISDLMPVLNDVETVIESPIGNITKILCSGTVASHTAGVTFVVVKEAIYNG